MWINPEIITPKHKAFVYKITNMDTGEKYIGKKNLFTRRYNKELERFEIKPSEWHNYQSSSTIASTWTNVSKEILYACITPAEAAYIETRLLYMHDVLDPTNDWVNRNIGGRVFTHYRMD